MNRIEAIQYRYPYVTYSYLMHHRVLHLLVILFCFANLSQQNLSKNKELYNYDINIDSITNKNPCYILILIILILIMI